MVQEQHPDRTRLYRQWRQLEWPIFVDSLNVLRHVKVVPIPMGLDENGVVVHESFRPTQLAEFIEREKPKQRVPDSYNRAEEPDVAALRDHAESESYGEIWRTLGEAYFNYGSQEDLDRAVAALAKAVELEPDDGSAHFALGGALRRRYESAHRQKGDAQEAVHHWGRALDIDPNHYIRRRRLQQYGPRLDKPYNFYFWVEKAREDIRERGETPVPLTAEPMGSEVAPPERNAKATGSTVLRNPDPDGRINRDTKNLVEIEPLVTPSPVKPGERVRVRVTYRLNEQKTPYWNNEADNLLTWVALPDGLNIVEGDLTYPNPKTPETQELRQIEFELQMDETVPPGTKTLPAYALYYVCEDAGGICYFLRQDFELPLTVAEEAPKLR